jgi:uncharacterized membrane protein YkgB
MKQAMNSWIERHAFQLLRISIGICYLWFGALKFFPHLSPAEDLAGQTITLLTFGLIPTQVSLYLLATWEVLVGIFFIGGWMMRFALPLMFAHMLFTLSPAFLSPDLFFTQFPFGLTLVGQYIIKNFVFISAALVLIKYLYPLKPKRLDKVSS